MKTKPFLTQVPMLILLALVLTACQTTQTRVDTRPRFYESATANVILQFNRWDTIHFLRPELREGGFLPIYNRDDIERELKTRTSGRQMAVVVLGFLFPPSQEAQYAREWDALLSAQGFQRVVVLRAGASKTTDGLLVVHDSSIGAAHEPTTVARAQDAALPSAAGANAPNSPGR